jgi:hypothetical protein
MERRLPPAPSVAGTHGWRSPTACRDEAAAARALCEESGPPRAGSRRMWLRARQQDRARPRASLSSLRGLGVVPVHIVDKVRALVLGLGLSKLRTEGGLSCSIVRPSSPQLADSS